MKKIIFVLMFSLGLVSATNIDAVCGENKGLKEHYGDFHYVVDGDILRKKLLLNHHSKEFKIDNKESVCAYMNVYDLSFLNTQLTQDDIEQFERYMAENGEYERYERSKEFYTQALKLFTYYRNHISSYKTQILEHIAAVGGVIKYLREHNGEIILDRFIYGKSQGLIMSYDSFNDFKEEVAKQTTCSETTASSKEELVQCANNKKILSPIVKWAESNMNQKAKGVKNDN